MTSVGVIVFENNLGEKKYQPVAGNSAKFWSCANGRGYWIDKDGKHGHPYGALFYKSKKRALRIARREVNRRQRSQSKNYYRTGEEK